MKPLVLFSDVRKFDSGYEETTYLITNTNGKDLIISAKLWNIIKYFDGKRDLVEISIILRRDEKINITISDLERIIEQLLKPNGLCLNNATIPPPKKNKSFLFSIIIWHARTVEIMAKPLSFLFKDPWFILLFFISLIISSTFFLLISVRQIWDINIQLMAPLYFYFFIFFGGFWHEIGHASACLAAGAKPGGVGVGFYLLLPSFYIDLKDTWKLSRKDRIKVDLGGISFTLLLDLVLIIIFLITSSNVITLFLLLNKIILIFNFLPFLKTDGYWVITDLLGVVNLHKRIKRKLLNVLSAEKKKEELRLGKLEETGFNIYLFSFLFFLIPFTWFLLGRVYFFLISYPDVVLREIKSIVSSLRPFNFSQLISSIVLILNLFLIQFFIIFNIVRLLKLNNSKRQ